MKRFKRILSIVLCLTLGLSCVAAFPVSADEASITDLRVNSLDTPLGVDDNPVFSWIIRQEGIGGAQSAYRIFVATTAEKAAAGTGDVWDSGKVESSVNYDVSYAGQALTSKTDYFWAVQVWDQNGKSLGISEAAKFHTGYLDDSQWTDIADWIGFPQKDLAGDLNGANWIWDGGKTTTAADGGYAAGTQYFRKTLSLDPSQIASVLISFTADDISALYVNGTLLGETAAWGTGGVVDATSALRSGNNVIAMSGTNTTNGYAGVIAKIVITNTDGSTTNVVTDRTWKVSRTEVSGWTAVEFDDSSWATPGQLVAFGSSPWGTGVSLTDPNATSRSAVNLRQEFQVSKQVSQAYAYICGLGFFTLTVNGQEVTDSVMNPATTQYDQTSLYCVYDVTDQVLTGDNAVGVELGNSFYNEIAGVWAWPSASWRDNPKLLFNLDVTYTDGTTETVCVSDTTWKVTRDGPITNNDLYYGDCYDARKALVDANGVSFDQAGYDDAAWKDAFEMQAPTDTKNNELADLRWQAEEPCTRVAVYKPESITWLDEDSLVIHVPEMVTGWAKLMGISEVEGQNITITYAEQLKEDGSVSRWGGGSLGDNPGWNHWWPDANIQQDHYISAGVENESYEPRYSYKGFEYIQIDGWTGAFTADNIEIYRIRNGMTEIGSFDSSNTLLNAIYRMQAVSIENNVQMKPTDCPMIEKNGWLGDANVSVNSMMYGYDMTNVMENFINIMADTQDYFGNVVDLVPNAGTFTGNNPTWNTIFLFGVTNMCQYYGNYSYAAEMYEDLRTFAMQDVAVLKSNGWLWSGGSYGDWCSPVSTPGNGEVGFSEGPSEGTKITDNGMLYGALTALAQVTKTLREQAQAAGDTDLVAQYDADIAVYEETAANLLTAFNNRFYKTDSQGNGYYETGDWGQVGSRTTYRQTSNVLPLAMGMVPEDKVEGVVKNLVNDIISKDYHLDTGVVGTKVLLPVLCQYGYEDIAFRIMTQTTYPSYGYWLSLGATSTWEMWESTSRSRGHYMFASTLEWYYSGLAGIADITNGYETFTIAPVFTGNLNYVNASVDTVRGTVTANWALQDNGTVEMEVVIPYGSTATVVTPTAGAARNVKVNGVTLNKNPEGVLSYAAGEEDKITLVLTSGTYIIACPMDTVSLYKQSLNDAITAAAALDISIYPEAKQEAFTAALEQARNLYYGSEIGKIQKNYNDAELALEEALASMQGSQARQDLFAAIAADGAEDIRNATATAAASYQSAVLTATKLANDDSVQDDALRQANQNLQTAKAQLASEDNSKPVGLLYVGLSEGTLNPVFSYFTDAYTVSVGKEVDSLILTPYATANTEITVNGAVVADGTDSDAIPLAKGENTITLTAGGIAATIVVTREEDPFLPGDLSGDGVLSVTDVVLLRKAILAGTAAADLPAGDLNTDGALSVTDVVLLRKAILAKG